MQVRKTVRRMVMASPRALMAGSFFASALLTAASFSLMAQSPALAQGGASVPPINAPTTGAPAGQPVPIDPPQQVNPGALTVPPPSSQPAPVAPGVTAPSNTINQAAPPPAAVSNPPASGVTPIGAPAAIGAPVAPAEQAPAQQAVDMTPQGKHGHGHSNALIKPNTNAYNGTSASTQLLPNTAPMHKPGRPADPFKLISVSENNPSYTVDVKYPQFDSIKGNDPSKLNDEVRRYVMAQIDAARSIMPASMLHIEGPKPLSYIKGTCVVSDYRPDLLSMTVDLTNYAFQSAHPVEALSTFNYRLDTNQQFGLKDVFRSDFKYIPALSKIAISTLSTGLDDDGIDWVRRGAAPEEKNFGKFQITDLNLNIIFDPYTIDNGADGFRTVPVSWDRVRANVSTEAPFHKLVSK